jgi:hypothetical protein
LVRKNYKPGFGPNFGFETGLQKKKITDEKQQSYAKKE